MQLQSDSKIKLISARDRDLIQGSGNARLDSKGYRIFDGVYINCTYSCGLLLWPILVMFSLIGSMTISEIWLLARRIFCFLCKTLILVHRAHSCWFGDIEVALLPCTANSVKFILTNTWNAIFPAAKMVLFTFPRDKFYLPVNAENPIKFRCQNHKKQILLWMDYRALILTMEDDHHSLKVSDNFTRETQNKHMLNYFVSKPKGDGYKELIDCLKSSLELPHFHLGHYSILRLLTEDTCLQKSEEYTCNLAIRLIIIKNKSQFLQLINVRELLPIMKSKQLLTYLDEQELLLKSTTDGIKALILLTELLETKGHCGYNIFLECLEEEHCHSGHSNVADMISNELKKSKIHRPQMFSLN